MFGWGSRTKTYGKQVRKLQGKRDKLKDGLQRLENDYDQSYMRLRMRHDHDYATQLLESAARGIDEKESEISEVQGRIDSLMREMRV